MLMKKLIAIFTLIFMLCAPGALHAEEAASPSADSAAPAAGEKVLRWGGDSEGGFPYMFPDPKDPKKADRDRLVLSKGHAAPALVVGADLLLAAALLPLHPSAPLAAQILQPLVILGQIHVAALAGVHDLPLGHPGHRLLRRRLGGGVLLLGLLPATLAALRALGRHRLPDLLALGGRGGLAGGLWLFGGRFLRRLLLVGVGEDHLDAGDRIVLRQVFKDQRELLICQRLHVVFGSLGVFRQDLRDGLGGKAEILRHLMDSVFLNTQ